MKSNLSKHTTFVKLKKITIILFLSAYLFATTGLSELFKLPILIQHFAEHKQENKNLTLWQFLCIHYAHGDVKDADYDKDMKLPFKTHDNCTASIICISSAESLTFSIKSLHFIEVTQRFFLKDFQFSSLHLSNIWQPPKAC